MPQTKTLFLEELKGQWLAMIDAIEDPLVVIRGNYEIVRCNKAYYHAALAPAKIPLTEVGGKKCYTFFANRNGPCTHCQVKTLSSSQDACRWVSQELHPGQTYEIRSHLVADAQENTFFVVHYRNTTEQEALLRNLAHADKLAAVGKLAGGVAHEINSPLAGILAFAQMLLHDLRSYKKNFDKQDPSGFLSQLTDDVTQIQEAAHKCKDIVENLLSFARLGAQPAERVSVSVFTEMKAALNLALGLLKKNRITYELRLEEVKPGQDVLEGQVGQIGQIYLNLIMNSIQAMPQGGHVLLEGWLEPGRICTQITDTGHGIPKEIQHKIFDPFFTTKPVGEGTGLGLSITYSLVQQYHGKIQVDSQENKGARFFIVFER